jgi:hypothetical protein
MQVCIINNPKFERSGTRKSLHSFKTVTMKQFLRSTDLDGSGWIKGCPYPGCGHTLRVSLVDEDTGEYSAWCPECGWLPEDGWEPQSPYLTIKEAAVELEMAPTTMETLVKGGFIGALSFARNEYSDWRVPRRLVDAINDANGDWTIYMDVSEAA